jgi:hypothetical protein
MPLAIPENFVNHRITLSNALGGASAVSSVAIAYEAVATYADGDFARISNILRDALAPRYDNSWLLGPNHALGRFGGNLVAFDDSGTEAGTGTSTVYAPPGLAYVVAKKTANAGRAFQGRMYMPGVFEGSVDEAGIIDGTVVNNWQATMDQLFTDLVADTAIEELALLHDANGPLANTPTALTSFVMRNIVGSMRPRQRR